MDYHDKSLDLSGAKRFSFPSLHSLLDYYKLHPIIHRQTDQQVNICEVSIIFLSSLDRNGYWLKKKPVYQKGLFCNKEGRVRLLHTKAVVGLKFDPLI